MERAPLDVWLSHGASQHDVHSPGNRHRKKGPASHKVQREQNRFQSVAHLP